MSGAAKGMWTPTRLAEIAHVARGRVAPQDHPSLPFIGMDNVEAHTMRLHDTVPAATMKSASVHFFPGDVLYGRLRPYLNKVIAPDFEGLASAEFIPLTMPKGVAPRFIQYRINASDFVSYASRLDEGDRPRVDYDQIGAFAFDLPPSSEQQRIVAAIESYFTRLDDAVATLERVQRNLKRYRASVLKAAVEGRLVPTEAELARAEGRSYEPAPVLLTRILAERRRRWEVAELAKMMAKGKAPKDDKWKAKYVEPVAPDTTELPALPAGWCWVTLHQVTTSVRDGPHYSPKYSPAGVPFVSGGNVRPEGVDFVGAKRISAELHAELSKRVRPQQGDILYTKGGTTGIARVNTYAHEFSVWVHVAVLKLPHGIAPFYLQHALNSPWCYAQAQRYTHGVGNQDLGLTRMINITIPLPPLAEQNRIVSEVDRLDSLAVETRRVLQSSTERLRRLRQSILKWAFEGRLVDQDPTDEPASVLLERIRAERTSATTDQRGNRTRKSHDGAAT